MPKRTLAEIRTLVGDNANIDKNLASLSRAAHAGRRLQCGDALYMLDVIELQNRLLAGERE